MLSFYETYLQKFVRFIAGSNGRVFSDFILFLFFFRVRTILYKFYAVETKFRPKKEFLERIGLAMSFKIFARKNILYNFKF